MVERMIMVLAIAGAIIVFGQFFWVAALPVVKESWSTGKCIEVIGDDRYSCGKLPPKYHKEWVK